MEQQLSKDVPLPQTLSPPVGQSSPIKASLDGNTTAEYADQQRANGLLNMSKQRAYNDPSTTANTLAQNTALSPHRQMAA